MSVRPTSPQRRLKVDYVPLIERAVAALDADSKTARASLYERARNALLRSCRSYEPPMSFDEIAAELGALDEAIERVDASMPLGKHEPLRAVGDEPAVTETRPITTGTPVRTRNPLRRAALPLLILSVLAWGGLIYYGPFYDPATPPLSNAAGVVLWTLVTMIILGTVISAWWRRKRCRDAGLVAHRHPAFARRRVTDERRREVAADMDDRALFWAHVLPDHQPEAKAVLRRQLQHRGHTPDIVDAWVPDAADLTVPSTLERPVTMKHYAWLIRARTWAGIIYLTVIVILTALTCFFAAQIIVSGATGELKLLLGFSGVVMLALAAIASLPFRNRAVRILLLRPFGERRMTRALKRFVRKNPGLAGYVYTLSDRNYKPSLLITLLWRLPAEGIDLLVIFLLGPLLGHSKRIASVRNERKFRKLERHLLRKSSPCFWSFMSGSQAFNIRSTDAWWRLCIRMLMHSCEIIVVDLSKVKEGTAWELDQLRERDLFKKCIFIVGEAHVADVRPVLERFFPPDKYPTVYAYRQNGALANQAEYKASFEPIMAAGIARWG
jgi:hypothetical protein